MLKVNCLLENTAIVEDLKDAVKMLAMERAVEGKPATLSAVYNDLRKAGVEIDLRTTGLIYGEVLPSDTDVFSSREDIDEITGWDTAETIRKIVLNEPIEGEEQIGKMSPEEYVANGIANLFYNDIKTGEKTQSVARTLQDAMMRGAKRMLPTATKDAKTKEDYQDIIQRAIALESKGVQDVQGNVNGINKMFEATKAELKKITDAIEQDGDEAAKEEWNNYIESFEQATYSLLFSKNEARDVLNGILKEAGYTKETKDGKQITNWTKLAGEINDVQQLRDNAVRALERGGMEPDVAEKVAASLEQEFIDLRADILEKASFFEQQKKEREQREEKRRVEREEEKERKRLEYEAGAPQRLAEKQKRELDRRLKRIEEPPAPTVVKSDLKKLAELQALGVFNRQYDEVLYKALGVNELDIQDMMTIQDLTTKASRLSAELDGNDMAAGYAFQTMQRDISKITARNMSDRTRFLKIVGALDQYTQAINAGRIANVYNMTENNMSGVKEMLAANLNLIQKQGWKAAFKDRKLFWAVWKDVTLHGGIQYGEELTKFTNKEYINDLYNRVDFKNASSFKEYARALAALIITPARAFLSGSDAAFKAVIHKKQMQVMWHKAMTDSGVSKDEAYKTLNEALYGQSFEQAKAKAKQLMKKYKLPDNDNAVTRMANDLVIANLNSTAYITNDIIDAAYKSAYKVSAIGLGHQSQWGNIVSERMEAYKRKRAEKQQKYIKEGNSTALAWARLSDVFFFNIMNPFTQGIANWAILRVQSNYGLGILTGGIQKPWTKTVDATNPEALQKQMYAYGNSRQQMFRGMVGLMWTGMWTITMAAIAAGMDDDEEDEEEKSMLGFDNVYKTIEGNYFARKAFLRNAPDLLLADYFAVTLDNPGMWTTKYIQSYFNLGSEYAMDVVFNKVIEYQRNEDYARARGTLAGIVGSKFEVPFWRSYKGTYQLVRGAMDGDYKPKYYYPYSVMEGVLGGGMFEDIGLYRRDSPIEALPGIGPKTAEKMNKAGIYKMSDIPNHSNWKRYIPEGQRKKAQEAYDELYAE